MNKSKGLISDFFKDAVMNYGLTSRRSPVKSWEQETKDGKMKGIPIDRLYLQEVVNQSFFL
ncbi:hypothetical protein AB0758_00640 [Tolypothrix bouteillei VB521301_2]|uniref:hypothetical protein n=1 Tax=Tolypothrix bouteillei TaxID=1246981 RepID=UPI0038B4FFD9